MSEDSVSEKQRVVVRLLTFFIALPFVSAPVLSIFFPKVLAYIMPVSGLIGAGILFFGLARKPKLPEGLLNYAVLVLILIAASNLWAFYPEEAMDRTIKLLLLIPFSLLFIAVMYSGASLIKRDTIMHAILVSASIAALILSVDILSQGYIYLLTRGASDTELYSTAVYNKGSIVIVVLGMCAFMLHSAGPTVKRALRLLPIAVMLFVIQSQATQVGLVLAAVIFLLFPYKYRWAWVGAFMLVTIGLAIKPLIAPMAYEQLAESFQNVGYMQQAYAAHRLEIWDYVSREIWISPIIGHGLEFTREFNGFDSAKIFLPEVNPMHPHSFILQIWIEFGIVGIALTIAGVGALIRTIYNLEDTKVKRTAFAALAAIMFIASITFGLWQGWWMVFMMMVAALFVLVSRAGDDGTTEA